MGYVRAIKTVVKFEGQDVHVTIKPIEYGDFMRIETVTSGTEMREAILLMAELVRKYVTLEQPPKAADGSAVTVDEVCTSAYFIELVTDLGKRVIEGGRVADPLVSAASLASGSAVIGNLTTLGAAA